jgi:RNA polymerase sigma factor (TIGR02999 family)
MAPFFGKLAQAVKKNLRPTLDPTKILCLRGFESVNIEPADVTQLLLEWNKGDRAALDRLMPVVYDELRRLAQKHLWAETPGHTLQATALVNEAYLRLVDQRRVNWQNRAHFFGAAAQIIRRLLVDHARARNRQKRGAGALTITLTDDVNTSQGKELDVVALDDALRELAKLDPQQEKIVELRFFTGLSIEDTAEALNVSPATIKRDWATARAWLYRQITTSSQ